MTRLIDQITNRADNSNTGISIVDWARQFRPGAQFSYNGMLNQAFSTNGGTQLAGHYGANAVVFACTANRMLLFSEARFLFQQLRAGRPADLFFDPAILLMETPWKGASTRELLAQSELDVTQYGNSYWVKEYEPDGTEYLLRLDPQYVRILTVGAFDSQITGYQVGERLAAYVYIKNPEKPVTYLPDQVAHYKPYPDQWNRFLGCSWLSACLPDIDTDEMISRHKQVTLGKGADLRYAVSMDPDTNPEEFEFFVDFFRRNYEGPENAGKTLMLGGGADIKMVGQTFENLAMKAITDGGEARVAACSGVPPVIVGLIPGLDSSTYSNYGMARRRLSDGTLRPLWGSFASSFSSVLTIPSASRLWYDDRDIPFLRDDAKDVADIAAQDANTLKTYVEAGADWDAAVMAVTSGDMSLLKGKQVNLSVQIRPQGIAEVANKNAPQNTATVAAAGQTPKAAPKNGNAPAPAAP